MKALKLSAVIFTALVALSACKTAPGGSSAEAKLREGLNDALGQVGNVAGMTGYARKGSEIEGGRTYSFSQEIYFDNPAAPASYKETSSTVYNGTFEKNDGTLLTFDNEIVDKGTTTAGVKLLAKGTDYISYKYIDYSSSPSTDVPLTDADLAGYVFIELTAPVEKYWGSPKSGGTGQWETRTPEPGRSAQVYGLKIDGNKLYFISVWISGVDQSVTFNNRDPRSPSEQDIYTKK